MCQCDVTSHNRHYGYGTIPCTNICAFGTLRRAVLQSVKICDILYMKFKKYEIQLIKRKDG